MDEFYVEIVKDGEIKPETRMGPMDLHRAGKVEDGASINLNHAEFHTQIVNADGKRVDSDTGEVIAADR